ncbi:MAG: DUF4982 domain-containing protein [Cyclobacteriaceae bacterium]
MNKHLQRLSLLMSIFFFASCGSKSIEQQSISSSRISDFNFGWDFQLMEDTLSSSEPNSERWESVSLPHDWSVSLDYDSTLEGATAYLPGGVGWYKKDFTLNLQKDEVSYIVFDGVYNRSTVWLNGKKLGFQAYGYSPFYYPLTDALVDGSNTIKVQVDRSRYVDSRWYTGSGIYRNVKLIKTKKLHIPVWGVFITTPEVSETSATVAIDTKVMNAFDQDQIFTYQIDITEASGKVVASTEKKDLKISAGAEFTLSDEVKLKNPALWSLTDPTQYKAISKILLDGKVYDLKVTSFGIREAIFDPNTGFTLNGVNLKIKGVCLHHDGGLVGSAVPKGVWRRRLETLKAGGVNAVRIAHNPAADDFLDLCDEMGILVQDEFYDEWDYPKDKRLNQEEQHDDYISRGHAEFFQQDAEKDLKNTMLAHRNHPSIIQWSIGNEIEWTYHPRYRNITGYFNMNWTGNYFWELPPLTEAQIKENVKKYPPREYELAKTAQKLSAWTKELDTTRAVVANCILPSASHVTGYADALDVVGYSYRRVLYDYGHENYPDKVIMGTENLGQWHEWKAVLERPFISGVFLWTGIDYMGETHDQWPRKALPSGLLNVAGFEKPSYYQMKSLWTEAPSIYIATQTEDKSTFAIDEATGEPVEKKPGKWKNALWIWQDVNQHWNYEKDDLVIVEMYSNCDEIELFLNEKSLGKKSLADFEDHIYKWGVPFEEGKLVAVGTLNGKTIESSLFTSEAVSDIKVNIDKSTLKADGYDVAHIEVQLVDKSGNPVRIDDRKVSFDVSGPVDVLGVDNGAENNTQTHNATSVITDEGRALMIIQSKNGEAKGKATVVVSGEGLTPSSIEINISN